VLDIFEQYQTLFSNLIVLVAAFVGFLGVIYSQRKLARMATEQRDHDEKSAKARVVAERNDEIESLVNALLGELSALELGIANAVKLLAAQISLAEELARQGTGRKTQPRIAFRFATPVFDSHVGRIGLLRPEHSFQLSNLYGQLKAFAANSQSDVPEMDATMAGQVMASVKSSLVKLDAEMVELKTSLKSHTALSVQPYT
jgi:hypothetical protein